MAKVQFQGYAQGKGFSSIDPGYAELSRTREKFQEDLSNVKDQQRKAEQRDAEAEANLERVMRAEEANRKDIYIEDKVFSGAKSFKPLCPINLGSFKDICINLYPNLSLKV